MADQKQLAETFHKLHIKGNPIVIYNVWDTGTALAVESAGAKAIATGGHGVAEAQGYEDGEDIPLETALANARRITDRIELPFSMDIDTGYGETPEEVKQTALSVIDAGVIGINIEDRFVGTKELRTVEDQAARLRAIREAADEADVPLYINARTDLFIVNDPSTHDAALIEECLIRAEAFKTAGASGLFVPGLSDLQLIRELCEKSPLPVNIIRLPGVPSSKELAEAGVARISYGPVPYLQMIDWLKAGAKKALALED